MDRVSNRFFAHLIKDGKSVSVVLRTNTTLTQSINQAGVCDPNWNADEQDHDTTPVISASCRLSGKPQPPMSGYQWKWNGQTITFGAGNKSNGTFVQTVDGTDYPMFEKTTVNEGGKNMPALKILRNLANSSNTNNDTIGLDGELDAGGVGLGFSVFIPVRIEETSGSGWSGRVDGDPSITEARKTATLTAHLKNGGESVQNFTAKFFREGVDISATPPSGYTVSAQNGAASVTYTDAQITDNVVIRCEFYVTENGTDTLVDTVYFNIDDDTDVMELQIASKTYTTQNSSTVETGTGQADVLLRDGQDALFICWMGHRQNPDSVYSGYTKFYAKLTDNSDTVIAPSVYKDLLLTEGQPKTVASFDANFVDITVALSTGSPNNDPVTATGGKIHLTADFLESHGDGVGGVIVAE